MKQVDTLQESKRLRTTHSRWRLWCVMLLAVFIGTASSFGQQDITWQSLSSDDLYRNGLDEDKKLTFYFQAEKTAATAEIQITLPKGVKVTAATPVVATGAGNDYTFGTATAAPSGDKTIVTIPITGGINNGEVGSGTLKVLANGDAAVGTAAITAKVVAAGITDAGQSANVKVENPQLNLIYTKPADGSDYVGGAEHKIVLTSTKGKAKMTTIVLTVDDSFTLDEASFTAGTVVKSGNKYTLTFTNEVLSISGKELKFKSKHPVMGGNRSIKCEIKTDCNVSKVENLNFLVPVADVGTTNLSILKVEFVGNDNGTPVKPSSSLCYETGTHPTMDGSLVFVKSTLKNTGTGAIGFFRVEQNGYPGGLFYHKVGETAYYQIDNGPLKAVPANMHQYKLGGEWLSYMTEVPLPAGVDQWSRHLTLYIYDEVPAGKEVVVYFPGHYGKIYLDDAASNKKNILTDSRDYHIGARIWVKEVKNKNGDNGVSGAVYSAYKDSPRFYERAEGLTFTDENPTDQTQIIKEEVQMNLRTGYVGTGSEYASTLKIDHPAWLEIENVELNELSYAGGTPLFSVNPTGTPGEYTINRSDAYKGGLKLLLKCSYKVKQDAKPTGNASGEIKYSLTQKLTINSAVVSTLETSRLIQPVHYVRDFNGIKLQSFELKRDKSSQGYAPLNNEKGGAVADGTTDPTQNLIDHTIYIAEDKGAFVWNVELIDAVNVGESIFLPLETNNFALGVSSDGLTFDTPLIGGVPNPALSYKKVDDQRGYLQYTPTAKLNGSSVLTFTLPFTVKGQRNATRPITSNALIGASSDNPITPTGTLKGNSVMSLSMGTYNLEPQFDALIEGVNFPSATTQKDLYVYMYTFWSNYLPAPHFPYEVRSLAYPSKLIVKVPKGYTLEKLSLKKYGRTVTESKNEAGSADLLTGLTADTSDPEYDVYTTNIGDLYGPGKTWPYPDEKWEQCLDYKLQASTRVKAASKISFEVKYSNPITGKDVLNTTKSRELTYSGPSISLETLATLQPADKAVTEMDVKFINTSTSTVKDNWLMLEGDFDGLVLVGGTTSDVVEGKFVKVSPSIVSKGTQSVSLKFNYKGTDGGTIKVTPLSGWTAAYTPSGTPSDNNMGVGKTVTIQPLANKLDASLKVDNVMFKEGETYKLTATLSSESSAGDISNPTMEITVPAGQEVKSAVATYNGITYTLTAAEFNAAFPLAGDKFTFDIRKVIAGTPANITFPGFNSQPNLDEQIATLEITYEPKSGTPTDGTMHFTGTAQASGVNAGAITASVESQKMAPRLDLANMLTVSVTSANKAFSSVSNTYDLIVEVEVSKKTSSFDVNDYMELDIPKYLTVGTPTVTSGTTSVTDTDDSGASRLVKLVLPIGNLNSVGDKITYTIPVTYDGVGAEQALPKKTLVAKYMTKTAIFGNNQIVAASTSSLDVLFVKTNAVSIFADQTPGETLTIESNGVTGKFDGGAAASSKVVTAAHSTQNDIAAAAGFTAKETVEVIYETQSYGMVDLPYTVYPSLVYTLSSNTFTDCGTVTVPFSTLVTAKTATNTTVKFYSDAACTSEITDASKAYTNSTTVYAFATNQGNPNVSTAKAITITVNANLGVTIAPATTTLTAGNSFTLTTSLTGTAPSGAKYKWYKGVAPSGTYVTTTTVPTYTKDNAAIADGGSYYVVVLNNDETSTGICGNTSSNAATVSVVAAPPAVTFVGSASDYVFCDAVSGGLTLWDAISSDKSTTGVTYWYAPTAGAGGGLTEVNAGSPCPITSAGSFFVKSKNAADTYSTEEELKVVVNTSVSAGLTAAPTSVVVGDNITLTASGAKTSGSKGTFYQFYKNGTALDAATNTATKTYQATSTDVSSGLSFTVKIVNDASGNTDGLCGALESTAQTVTVTDRPEKVELKKTVETINDCGANATLDLMSLIDNMTDYTHNETFYWSETDNSSTATAFTQTISLSTALAPGTKHNVFVWAKNAYNFSLNSTKIEVYAIKYAPIALGTVSAPDVEEVAGAPATLTVTVTGTTGEKGTGDYTYRLYDAQVGGTLLASNTTGVLTQTVTAPSLTATSFTGYVEYTYYVSAQGICDESIPQEVKVKVYPKATIEANTTDDVEFCTDNTSLSSAKLADYLTDALRTQWFDYTYDVSGAATATNQSLDANTPLPRSEGTYTYTLRATNRLSGSTAATATLTVKIAIPIALSPITTPQNLEGTGSISLIANPTAGTPVSFEWYKDAVKQSETSGTLSFSYGHTDPNTAFTTNTYYAKALGAIACADAQTNNVVVNVYPTPTLSLATTSDAYCEDNAVLTAGIDLWSYINTPNDVWFTYTYSGNGVTDGALAAGTVTIPTQPGTYTYTIKAVNKLATSTLEATETITIKVDRQTKITNQPTSVVVTEWDAFTLSVEAVAEGAITYQWEKWNTYLQVFETVPGATSATYVVNRSVAKDAGLYRVVVTGGKGTACGKKVIPSDEVNVQVNPNGLCQITYASSEEGELVITDTDGNVITSGTYVVPGTKVKAMATARTAGYDLWQLVANGTVIDNNSMIEIAGHTHFFAHFTEGGKNPNPDKPGVGNVEVTDGSQIWTNKGYVHILTEKPCKARIITFTGRVLIDRAIPEGETQIYMPEGLYIVTLSDGTREKVSVKY